MYHYDKINQEIGMVLRIDALKVNEFAYNIKYN